jgi:demethylmenaquinone methyltransferase/2-methoxy-6-polyprenyl-1,4-benzoquinol methylase
LKAFRLPTSQEKAEYVQRQFDRIARGYDLTNDAISLGMHRWWKKRAVDELLIKSDGCYLDVCCGTGDLVIAIARRLCAGGVVTGVDFSRNMLEVASRRALKAKKQQHLPAGIKLVEGDAQQLPFPEDSFDGAVMSFGLRNLTDLLAGLKEMARVVRPGGPVVNLDLGHPTAPVFTPLFSFYFRRIVPIIGGCLQRDRQAYTYLPESTRTYPRPAELSELFRQAGLIDVRHVELAVGSVALHVGTVAPDHG